MGKIVLSGLEFHARHGVHPEEEKFGARFVVDVEMETAFEGKGDVLAHTTDYSRVYLLVKEFCTEKRFYLIEALADQLADSIIQNFGETVTKVLVRVHKPFAPIAGVFRDVYVETCKPG